MMKYFKIPIRVRGAASRDRPNRRLIFKSCVPFTKCISKISNTQLDNAKDLDIVVSIYNLLASSTSYSKTLRSLLKYFRDDPSDLVTDFA